MWWQLCLFLCPEGRTSAQPFPHLRDRPCRHVPSQLNEEEVGTGPAIAPAKMTGRQTCHAHRFRRMLPGGTQEDAPASTLPSVSYGTLSSPTQARV